MKKKLLIILPILIFAMIFLYKMPSYATQYDRYNVEYTLPDQFEVSAGFENEEGFFTIYYYELENGENNSVNIFVHSDSETIPLTQEDMEAEKQAIINSYKGSEKFVTYNNDAVGKMIEIDGVPGYQITHSQTKIEERVTYSLLTLSLHTDKITVDINISGTNQYPFTNEVQNIINSIKIKDTLIKAKGIPFHDVSTSSWYYNAVKYTYENNMISGLNKYTFAPNDNLTRAMLVTILWRMEGSPANNGKSKFTDVASNTWYSQAVKWAADNKIVNGYGGTIKFGPKDNVTRQDLAVILRNYANYKGKNVNVTANLTGFKDYKQISNYAKASMEWAVGKKVITGNTSTKTLNPKGTATRAEAASMIMKYCNNVGK